jgi:uncharacterized protein (UPF0147 family)
MARNTATISSLNGIVKSIRDRKNDKGEADVLPNERNAAVKLETAVRLLEEVDKEPAAPAEAGTPNLPAPAKAAAK